MDYKEARTALEALLSESGVTLEIQPVLERHDSSDFKDAAHYRFTVKAGRVWHFGFYSSGWGNYTRDKAAFRKALFAAIGVGESRDSDYWLGFFNGKRRIIGKSPTGDSVDKLKIYLAKKNQPALVDIVSALLMDASNADQPFADWCADYGYSDDSIKAKDTWEKCNETRRFLQSALPSAVLSRAYDLANEM